MSSVCHIEIPILDLEKAKEFYQNVFKWEVNTEALPKYALANQKDQVSIGMPLVEQLPEIFTGIYFQVEDIPSVLSKIEKAGGKILQKKTEISPEIGYAAKFEDCFGNSLRLFSSN
ncbi:MAG: VOC family protein [Candidatus Kariarchaeaceae archaeon]|jgi:predicted enzyme related to lactoylglutathione lyase